MDSRRGSRARNSIPTDVAIARASLARSLGSQGLLQIDPITGTPRVVARLDGFLTGPRSRPAGEVPLDYIRAHLNAFGLDEADLAQMHLFKDYVDNLGTHHLVWQQQVDGIPAFDNGLRANVTADGRLISIMGSPIHALHPQMLPDISGAEALTAALRNGGARTPSPSPLRSRSFGPQERSVWSGGNRAELVLFGGNVRGGATLAWQVNANVSDTAYYVSVVDASSGAILWRANMVDFAVGNGTAWGNYPGATAGGSEVPVTFPVFNRTRLSGDNAHVYRDVNDTIAVPGPVPPSAEVPANGVGPRWNDTLHAVSPLGHHCSPAFPCSWNSNVRNSWQQNLRQNAVQAYHFLNVFHDHLKFDPDIAFTERAGNFEQANPPGVGRGGDAVQAQIDDGANTDNILCDDQTQGPRGGFPDFLHATNANMLTAQDGVPPQMQMYLFPAISPCRVNNIAPDANGGDDASVIYHEYTHGLSNRMVTTNTGIPALNSFQAGAMGEAWSDWYALDFLVDRGFETDHAANGDLREGRYVTHGQGIRTEGIDCRVGVAAGCPGTRHAGRGGYTYGDMTKIFTPGGRNTPEVHADGEIWAQTLWDIRRQLGVNKAEKLITRGMELSPPEPSFLDMRNAILQADRVAFGGSDQGTLWNIFRRRGMGFFADTLSSNDVHPIQNFQSPPVCPGPKCATVHGTIRDSATRRPVAGAVVGFTGHTSFPSLGFPIDLSTRTKGTGRYTIRNVPFHLYKRLVVIRPGYEPRIFPNVRVNAARETVGGAIVRDWAASSGGGRIAGHNGPNYTVFGCGPIGAIDLSLGSGWGSDAVHPPQGSGLVPGNKFIVVRLPRAVNVSTFGLDPGATCGDDDTAGVKAFTIQTRKGPHAPWVTAVVRNTALSEHVLHLLTPHAGRRHVLFVKFIMRGTRSQAPVASGRFFMDMSELTVHGKPA